MSDNETAGGAYKRDESKREELEKEKLIFKELEKRIAATKYLWGCTSSSERVKVNNYPFGFTFGTNIWAPSSEDYLTWQTSSSKSTSSDNGACKFEFGLKPSSVAKDNPAIGQTSSQTWPWNKANDSQQQICINKPAISSELGIYNPEFGLKSSQSSNNLSMSQDSSQLCSSDEMEGSCQQQISVSQPATSSELGAQSSHAFTFKNFTSSQLRSQNMPYDEDNDCQQPTASKSTNPSNQDEKKQVWVLDSSWDNVPTTSTHGSQLWCNANDVNNNHHVKQQISASNPTFSIDYGNFANVTNIVRYPWRSYYYESGNVKYFEQHLGDSASSIHHYQNRSNDVEFCYCEPNSDEIYFRRFQAGYRVGSQNWFHEDDCSSTTSTSTMSQYTSANLQSPIENQRQFSGNQWSGSAELQPNAFAQNFNYMNGSRHGVDKNKRHRMTDRKYKSQEKSICTFCRKNGEPASSYSTHLTKDDEGNITCPILKAYVCQKCGATGRSAHTDKYCHYN